MIAETDEIESTRADFEEAVYKKYFVSQISRTLLLKKGVADKATLLERKKKGAYRRPEIAAMWFGWKLRIEAKPDPAWQDRVG